MDNALDYGSRDSRFDSWQIRLFFKILELFCISLLPYLMINVSKRSSKFNDADFGKKK